ncbi:hypothetical protein PsorP6_008176 [Peronosclerospora sorghi]|uniref:Uncharacterized protein n=1 Tax=Peronosclerospora sorghi TaxID=230839 RepID=A0ACC0W8X2_9STRA|nr:hypothetical protein PsorP6_008176 [Peronosclerospora sorghi]
MTKRNRWDSDSDSDVEQNSRRKQKSSVCDKSHSIPTKSSSLNLNDFEISNCSIPEDIATTNDPPRHNFYLLGCRSVDCYARIGKIDEGTYGVVSKARDKETGDIVALKQVKMSADVSQEGFPVTALRETNVLLALDHPNIVQVREMVVGSTPDKIYMVMDYAENDLKHVMQTKMKAPWLQSEVKYLLHSLLSAMAYMHDRWYIHRDLKTSNLLYDARGVLKNWPRVDEDVPEANVCVRGKWPKYSRLRDKFPLAATFSGSGCSLSNAGFDLLSRMLALSPRKRISARDALAHEYFRESPPPKQQELMPTFPA